MLFITTTDFLIQFLSAEPCARHTFFKVLRNFSHGLLLPPLPYVNLQHTKLYYKLALTMERPGPTNKTVTQC